MASESLPGFQRGAAFDEQVREERDPEGVRMLFNAPSPASYDSKRPTLLIVYATPNGNTIEQTMGMAPTPGSDWHFDIQHIAAQTRRLREVDTRDNIVLVCAEAEGHSWPTWRQKHPDYGAVIRRLVEAARKRLPGSSVRVALTGHSGGGSFLFGFLNAADTIPDYVERIAFLDANYSYSDADRHGDKLIAWLQGDPGRRLVVIAYDDRKIILNGKLVVSAGGGTYRATHRMLDTFGKQAPLAHSVSGNFDIDAGLRNQSLFFLHRNPENKILHTALVGEMNGYLHAMTLGTPEEAKWGSFGGPRAYTAWIQSAAEVTPIDSALPGGIPARPADAPGGKAFFALIADLPATEREAAVLTQITQGNIPDFLRKFRTIRVSAVDDRGSRHTASYKVMPDYLAIGSDRDFVRIPMTPMTAQRIADRFGCVLPTSKIVEDIYRNAALKLEPRPLTLEREAARTFLQHNALIEAQRRGKPLGLLIVGIKKDVVLTNRLQEKPNRVAIYGWHQLDGKPIQPLTIVHRDTYVDYSHGIRLVKQALLVDGKPTTVQEVLKDPHLCTLLSEEGPLEKPRY
jgi:hypothetical protein